MYQIEKEKVLIITNHSYMLWRFRKELITALMEDHQVVLSMPFVGHEDDFREMGVKCIETKIDRRGINPRTDLHLMASYDRILRQEKPDMVITYSIKPNIYAGILCMFRNIPYYANVQGLGTAFQKKGLSQFVALLYKVAFFKVNKVFFENKRNAEEFSRRHIISGKKQKVLHGAGINLEHYGYEPYPSHETIHFLYLGRIMKEKGMDELLSAVNRLRQEGENFVLDIVGFFEDAYEKQISELEQEKIAVFYGFQENPKPYYAVSDCVVLPSYHEGMSNVLLEAAATGRPLITTNIPGCREVVEQGKTGILVQAKSSESLYKGMKKFLHLPHKKREVMGKLGREKMEKEFRKEEVVEETMQAMGL
ncbi:MAG: glycosyltransferase family 4 protein [Oliverpabstia sp.]|nr:glycosyltransferase family 4 protein [Eubacterium sp.]MDY2594410.1 glycosyltransferase family 4 protein [Oliverpabstia sp.]